MRVNLHIDNNNRSAFRSISVRSPHMPVVLIRNRTGKNFKNISWKIRSSHCFFTDAAFLQIEFFSVTEKNFTWNIHLHTNNYNGRPETQILKQISHGKFGELRENVSQKMCPRTTIIYMCLSLCHCCLFVLFFISQRSKTLWISQLWRCMT